jgi:hypothetical protein
MRRKRSRSIVLSMCIQWPVQKRRIRHGSLFVLAEWGITTIRWPRRKVKIWNGFVRHAVVLRKGMTCWDYKAGYLYGKKYTWIHIDTTSKAWGEESFSFSWTKLNLLNLLNKYVCSKKYSWTHTDTTSKTWGEESSQASIGYQRRICLKQN